ncbi:WD repeat protein-like protein [Xylogone sp. PMI_703]|nr:WD repeat protein-like protein [Xylogone sp. PMI_703]
MSLQLSHTLNPITSLEFYRLKSGRLVLLAGEGGYLKVFDSKSSDLIGLYRIFQSQAIHGIVISGSSSNENELEVVIWGGSCISLIRGRIWESLLSKTLGDITDLETSISNWILDVSLSPTNHDRCSLITADNTLLQACIEAGSQSEVVCLRTLDSPSKSMLYSANVLWETESIITVAAGTVFGEIIVWECSISESEATSTAQVFYTLAGHEGSIFGVSISSIIMDQAGKCMRLLASCSDDRTIRIWDVSKPTNSSSAPASHNQPALALARETGFGMNDVHVNGEPEFDRCLGMVMGHASRIWNVKFLQLDSESLQVLSFGEDSTAQHWSMDMQPDRSSRSLKTLTHIDTFAFHSGKHLFSSAIRYTGQPSILVATGGADGKISSYAVSLKKAENPYTKPSEIEAPQGQSAHHGSLYQWELDLEEVLSCLPPNTLYQMTPESLATKIVSDITSSNPSDISKELPAKKAKIKKPPKDTFNRYGLVAEDLILATTTFGRVLTCKLGTHLQWEELNLPEPHESSLRSYSVVKGLPESGVAFATGTSGKIFVYEQGSTVQLVGDIGAKVTDMFPFVGLHDMSVCLLITTIGGMVGIIYQFDRRDEGRLFLKQSFTVSLPEKFIVTSAGYCDGFIILGSRKGSLAIYKPSVQAAAVALWKADAENGDAVTSITAIKTPSMGADPDKAYFLVTGKNGLYSIFLLSARAGSESEISSPIIVPVHFGTPPFGPVIEAGWFEGSELFLCGFKSKDFVVWNETKQCEIITVNCGNAHRSFAYSHLKNTNGGGYFIYTKASKLHIHYQSTCSHNIVKQGGHGREIKACAVSSSGSFMATGAEDTAIRLWRYHRGTTSLEKRYECLAVRQQHTAGIQHLQWHGDNYLFSSGGVEEFYVWSITPIPGFGIGTVREASCPDQSEEKDLRIMSFDITDAPKDMQSKDEQVMLISLAYSDSTIRTYTYCKSSGFVLLATGRYTAACLMQIQSIKLSSSELNLITAATDGKLTIWRIPIPNSTNILEWQMVSAHKIHQNSIKCMDLVTLDHGKCIAVATGGDDNGLGITVYKSADIGSPTAAPSRILLRSAHAAAITGLCCLLKSDSINKSQGLEFEIATSSNDQQVKTWTVKLNDCSLDRHGEDREQTIVLRKLGDAFTTIADVGDMSVMDRLDGINQAENWEILVVGNGMDIWNVGMNT